MLLSANTISDHCNDMINLRVKKVKKFLSFYFIAVKVKLKQYAYILL